MVWFRFVRLDFDVDVGVCVWIFAGAFDGLARPDAVFVGVSEADWGAADAAGVGFYGVAASPAARDRLLAAGASAIFAAPAALHVELNLPAAAVDP